MGWFGSENHENRINIKTDLDLHDITLYVIVFLMILVLIAFYIVHKCKKLETRHRALELRVAGARV